jgi:hypothetical protein
MLVTNEDKRLDDVELKAEKLRDDSQIDSITQLRLWKETIHFRRKCVRGQSTSDILRQFPGDSNPALVRLFIKCLISTREIISITGVCRGTNINAHRFESCCKTPNSSLTRKVDFNARFYHW